MRVNTGLPGPTGVAAEGAATSTAAEGTGKAGWLAVCGHPLEHNDALASPVIVIRRGRQVQFARH